MIPKSDLKKNAKKILIAEQNPVHTPLKLCECRSQQKNKIFKHDVAKHYILSQPKYFGNLC